jgi:MYXO-CTERM domain-containing protein
MPVGGDILARVLLTGAFSGARTSEAFGLSWDYTQVPAPGALALALAGGLLAARRRRAA